MEKKSEEHRIVSGLIKHPQMSLEVSHEAQSTVKNPPAMQETFWNATR